MKRDDDERQKQQAKERLKQSQEAKKAEGVVRKDQGTRETNNAKWEVQEKV